MNPVNGEAELVARAVDGDADALEQVVRTVQDAVYRLALRMTGLPADAEDATQEILIRVITRLSSWRAEAALTTWAYRIAVNYLLNQRRRSALERRELTFEELGAELADGLTEYQGPDAGLLAEEVRLRCTQAMLQCLDRAERLVYVLGEVFELPSEHAAWVLDTTAAAYRKRLERARRQVRAFVAGNCGLVNPDAACHCSRRIVAARAAGRLQPGNLGLARHPTTTGVPAAARQMHQLHDAASVLRSHPDYAVPRARSEAVLTLLRSGRFPLVDQPPSS
ncbi:MAG TPA: RNA polymerase sigma factor [Pseudonocardia sp.]|uniref:RNA polymerase sigma factor n=1 Tax=Pseudonocardia sp. TaxID=60912 RepID=UPI002CEE64FD|nr:RNA polymerase sigma factor [Pseudonocardia sp.]HTF54127.1 RNA polymerase sigma factor [Pseudonocardia sp.]